MAWTFKPRRVAVVAGVALAVKPPAHARIVKIGNATPDDLKVYEDPNDESTYFVIAAGYEKEIDVKGYRFDPLQTAFHLKPVQSGTAVLIWL